MGVSSYEKGFAAWARKSEAKSQSNYYKFIGFVCILYTIAIITKLDTRNPVAILFLFLMMMPSIALSFIISLAYKNDFNGGRIKLEFVTVAWTALGVIGALSLALGFIDPDDKLRVALEKPGAGLWRLGAIYFVVMAALSVTMVGAPRLLVVIIAFLQIELGTNEIIRTDTEFRRVAVVVFLASLICIAHYAIRHVALLREYSSYQQFNRMSRDAIPFLPTSLSAKIGEGLSKEGADSFSNLSVVFADISGFTSLSKRVSPGHLVEILNDVFNAADRCAERLGLEKVKTIGDCYMAVAGGSLSRSAGASEAIEFARTYVEAFKNLPCSKQLALSVRVGIHTGPAVGGVIGTQRRAYDYWGETVNLASRLEGCAPLNGCAMSEATFLQVATQLPNASAEELEIRGVGMTKVFRHSF